MPLTTEQRGKLVDFFLAVKSVVETKWAYCNHFDVRDASVRSTVWRTVKKFRTEMTVNNVNKGRSDQPKSVQNWDNIDAVCLSVRQSPKKSTQTKRKSRKITNFNKVDVIQTI